MTIASSPAPDSEADLSDYTLIHKREHEAELKAYDEWEKKEKERQEKEKQVIPFFYFLFSLHGNSSPVQEGGA